MLIVVVLRYQPRMRLNLGVIRQGIGFSAANYAANLLSLVPTLVLAEMVRVARTYRSKIALIGDFAQMGAPEAAACSATRNASMAFSPRCAMPFPSRC